VRGAIHAAGVIQDRPLALASAEELRTAHAVKVQGGQIMLDVARQEAFAFVALFSSLVARIGGGGQGAYAAANAGLSALARAQGEIGRGASGIAGREAGISHDDAASHEPRIVAIDWGPWRVGMASAPGFQARYTALGIRPLEPAEAALALEAALASDAMEVLALAHEPGLEAQLAESLRGKGGDTRARVDEPGNRESNTESRKRGTAEERNQLQLHSAFPQLRVSAIHSPAMSSRTTPTTASPTSSRPSPDSPSPLPRFIAEFLSARLRRRPDEIDSRAAFSRMGVDSLMAVELVKALEKRTGRRLYPTLLFEVPTIEALVHFLSSGQGLSSDQGPSSGQGLSGDQDLERRTGLERGR
jgi:acyl carrier protein